MKSIFLNRTGDVKVEIPNVTILGTTNHPWRLDKRFKRRALFLHIGLPQTVEHRYQILLLKANKCSNFLTQDQWKKIATRTNGKIRNLINIYQCIVSISVFI